MKRLLDATTAAVGLARTSAGAAVLVSALLAACTAVGSTPLALADPSPAVATAGMRCVQQTQWRLYFGFDTPSGPVRPGQWESFVAAEVVPRLASGFTLMAAHGQWRGADGRVQQEESRVLEVVGEDDLAFRHTLAEIAGRYKTRFQQEAVLITQSPTRSCR